MAMEYRHTIKDAHPKPILCVEYNPLRRELYTAGEGNQKYNRVDSTIRVWEYESRKLTTTFSEHQGWVTCLLYCKEFKILFSASIDGCLIAWGPTGKIIQKVQSGSPIYCLAYNSRRQQIMAGQDKFVRLFQMIGLEDGVGSQVLEKRNVLCTEHSDIVSCIVSCEGRFYSVGYDRKIIIYDVSHHGDLKLQPTRCIKDAHDAAISTLVYGKDADNSWLITGSFDRVVKLWSLDGNLMQRFDGFAQIISSVCYVVPSQTLWVSASSPVPIIYDPRSGINVSDFVNTDSEMFRTSGVGFGFKNLLFIPENNEVIGISTRRSLIFWKYNAAAPLTILPGIDYIYIGHTDIVECLTFSILFINQSIQGASIDIQWRR
jgi:WD40 repeat protein